MSLPSLIPIGDFRKEDLKTDNTLFHTFGPLVFCVLPINDKTF